MTDSFIVLVVGVTLIVFGMGKLAVCAISRLMSGRLWEFAFDARDKQLEAMYPGTILLGIGALLLIVGAAT